MVSFGFSAGCDSSVESSAAPAGIDDCVTVDEMVDSE